MTYQVDVRGTKDGRYSISRWRGCVRINDNLEQKTIYALKPIRHQVVHLTRIEKFALTADDKYLIVLNLAKLEIYEFASLLQNPKPDITVDNNVQPVGAQNLDPFCRWLKITKDGKFGMMAGALVLRIFAIPSAQIIFTIYPQVSQFHEVNMVKAKDQNSLDYQIFTSEANHVSMYRLSDILKQANFQG